MANIARKNDIPVHVDGARLMNASVVSGKSMKELSAGFQSVSVCLSKGMSVPISLSNE